MATVYLARQTDLDRHVALKELGAPYVADAAFAERFLRESRMAGSLGHTNIVTVHDFFEHDGTPYIAMEYLERGSLRPWVGKLRLAQIMGVLEGLLAGLAHAQARGVIHRDLKPENVMVTLEGAVKIADFGIAKAYNQAITSARLLTATGTAVGTPTYMAPEQAMARDIGPWTDLYSTGIMAYELVLGRVPFHAADTPMSILLHHVNELPPRPSSVDPTIDPELAGWIERLIEKDPAARPQTATEAWDELEDVILRLLGPRWRREARILAAPDGEPSILATVPPSHRAEPDVPAPATEAPIPVDVKPVPVPDSDFVTYRPGPGPAAEAAPPPPPAAEPVPAETAPAVAPRVAAEAAPVSVPKDEPIEPAFVTYQPPAKAIPPSEVTPAPTGGEEQEAGAPVAVVTPPPIPAAPPASEDAEVPPSHVGDAELALTVPPAARRAHSFEWPAVAPRAGDVLRGRRTWIVATLAVAVVGGSAVALLIGGGNSKSPPKTTANPAPLPNEAQPAASERVVLASSSALFLTTPNGYVARLDGSSSRPTARFTDPQHPRALALVGGIAYVGDDQAVTLLRAGDLTPVTSIPFPHASFIEGSGATVAAVGRTRAGGGRLCTVSRSHASPCVSFGFAPTGLGVTRSGEMFVADGRTGTIVEYTRRGSHVAKGRTVHVGKNPHGRLIELSNRLYVPVSRGISVVDTSTSTLLTTVRLPGTPSDLWLLPRPRRLFATLYAHNEIAVVDTASARVAATIPTGRRPVAITGAPLPNGRPGVFVYSAGAGTILRVDARSGKRLGTTAPAGLAARALPLAVRLPNFAAHNSTVTVTFVFDGGRLGRSGLTVRDRDVSDGHAAIELWQPGLVIARGAARTFEGLKVSISRASGHAVVTLSSKAGAFRSVKVARRTSGGSVVLTLAKAPPVHQQTTSTSQTLTTTQTHTTQTTQTHTTSTTVTVG